MDKGASKRVLCSDVTRSSPREQQTACRIPAAWSRTTTYDRHLSSAPVPAGANVTTQNHKLGNLRVRITDGVERNLILTNQSLLCSWGRLVVEIGGWASGAPVPAPAPPRALHVFQMSLPKHAYDRQSYLLLIVQPVANQLSSCFLWQSCGIRSYLPLVLPIVIAFAQCTDAKCHSTHERCPPCLPA